MARGRKAAVARARAAVRRLQTAARRHREPARHWPTYEHDGRGLDARPRPERP